MSDCTSNVLADFVRQRRKAMGMSQSELAKRAGVSLSFVCYLEQPKETLRLSKVNAVLAVFGKQLGIVNATPPHNGHEE